MRQRAPSWRVCLLLSDLACLRRGRHRSAGAEGRQWCMAAPGPRGARSAAANTVVTGLPASQYVSDTTTQPALVSLHMALEKQRILARRGQGQGPRIMVLGPPSSGKSTLVKSLVNMASGSGMGWSVGVAGLDPSSVRYIFSSLPRRCHATRAPLRNAIRVRQPMFRSQR